ncbi:MAG: DUF3098 domain-containing protein [Bacteroidales bacterium]
MIKHKTNTKNGSILSEPTSNFALGKKNYILIAAAFIIIILGLSLMAGSGSTPKYYNPEIFSWRRIVLAPGISFFGFIFIVYAIMYKDKKEETK